jgi:hypothetical protein
MTTPAEPPAVLPPLIAEPTGSGRPELNVSMSTETWIDRVIGGDSYGAPRVFDLFTLMAITLAFALMFAFLRLLEPILMINISGVSIYLGTFVTGIAIFQLALWGGKRPRLASLVGGPFLVLVMTWWGEVWRNSVNAFDLTGQTWQMYGVSALIFGIPGGYIGGAMVAGVFLIADLLRTKFLNTAIARPAGNDDDIFS